MKGFKCEFENLKFSMLVLLVIRLLILNNTLGVKTRRNRGRDKSIIDLTFTTIKLGHLDI